MTFEDAVAPLARTCGTTGARDSRNETALSVRAHRNFGSESSPTAKAISETL